MNQEIDMEAPITLEELKGVVKDIMLDLVASLDKGEITVVRTRMLHVADAMDEC